MKDLFRHNEKWPYHVSAGAVVVNDNFDRVALLKRSGVNGNSDTWHLPKGTVENGESLESAAAREVLEESGLEIEIIGYLGAITQQWITRKGLNIDKTVHYFIAKMINDTKVMDEEHDDIEWIGINLAKEKLKLEPKEEDVIIERAENFIGGNFES